MHVPRSAALKYVMLLMVVFSAGCVSIVAIESTADDAVCPWDKPHPNGLLNVLMVVKDSANGTVPHFPPEYIASVVNKTFFSNSLGKEKRYVIILPPSYDKGTKHYSVVYLLNGMCSNETSWLEQGDLLFIYDELLAAGNISEMIIAMPDGDNSAYENGCSGSVYYSCGNYEDYILKDFINEIDSHYRTIPDGKYRGIGGVSLGAEGAMRIALKHPGVFSSVTAHSGDYYKVIDSFDDAEWSRAKATDIQIYFDIGNHFIDLFSGFLYSNFRLNQVLNEKGISHEFHAVSDLRFVEMHSWTFWKTRFGIALERQCEKIC